MECTKHVVADQRDITIRDLRDRVAELEAAIGFAVENMLTMTARVASDQKVRDSWHRLYDAMGNCVTDRPRPKG